MLFNLGEKTMLSRLCQTSRCIIWNTLAMTAIFLPLKCFPTDLDNIKKEGELIGKDAVSKGLKFAKELNLQELLSPTDKGKGLIPDSLMTR